MLAFSPWHFFISRIGIENVPLPFFLALGLLTWTIALRSRSRWAIAVCLLPFAAAAYTYGIAILLLITYLPLLAITAAAEIRKRPRAWSLAFALFFVSHRAAWFVSGEKSHSQAVHRIGTVSAFLCSAAYNDPLRSDSGRGCNSWRTSPRQCSSAHLRIVIRHSFLPSAASHTAAAGRILFNSHRTRDCRTELCAAKETGRSISWMDCRLYSDRPACAAEHVASDRARTAHHRARGGWIFVFVPGPFRTSCTRPGCIGSFSTLLSSCSSILSRLLWQRICCGVGAFHLPAIARGTASPGPGTAQRRTGVRKRQYCVELCFRCSSIYVSIRVASKVPIPRLNVRISNLLCLLLIGSKRRASHSSFSWLPKTERSCEAAASGIRRVGNFQIGHCAGKSDAAGK